MATPSLAMIPSGYKEEKLYSFLPVPSYSEEKVTNGDFASSSGWTVVGLVTISSGVASFVDNGTNLNTSISQNILTIGKTYEITFDVTRYVAGNIQFVIGGTTHSYSISSGVGSYIAYYTVSGSDLFRLKRSGGYPNFDFDIDNVSVKEVLVGDGDFTFSRGSNATRVNKDGLIETVPLDYGSELVTNGDFATDSDWNKFGSFTISGGVASASSNGALTQASIFQSNKRYTVSFDLISNGQQFNLWVNGTQLVFASSLNSGSYTYDVLATISGSLYFEATSSFIGSIDNVSVKEVTGYNKPRLDYSDSSCPSLLLEPTRTNLIPYSEDFSDSSWIKSGVAITSNATISPDGNLNASLMTISVGVSDQRIYRDITYSGTNTVSVFAKAGSSNWLSIRIGSSVNKWYDLQNGVLGGSTITTSYVDADIQDYGNGWYRCILVFTDSATTSTRIYPAEDNNDITHTEGSVYIWGCQAESTASYPTSYIPTTDGIVKTRLQDVCTDAGDTSTFNSEEGVLFAEISALADDGTYRLMSIEDTSNTFIYLGYKDISNVVRARMEVGGVTSFNMEYVLSDETEFNKVAVKWKVNDFSLWVNGVEVETDTSGGSFNTDTLNKLSFNRNSSSSFIGKTKDVRVYNTALTDLEIEEISSWESFIAMANGQNYTIK